MYDEAHYNNKTASREIVKKREIDCSPWSGGKVGIDDDVESVVSLRSWRKT